MSADLSKKKIIMIHGLASKPPARDVHDLWSKCVIENVKQEKARLGAQLAANKDVFVSAYWANKTPHHVEDDAAYVKKLRVQVNKVIRERKKRAKSFHVKKGNIGSFFRDRGLDLANLLTGALQVQDDVMKAFLRETQLYDEDQYIADRMRLPLENALRDAWDNGQDIALLSHSMGTFISYDVVWRFSHRNVEGFREYRDKRVQMFATMGSPLGNAAVRGMLFARHHEKHALRKYPTNIDFWHNYACLGDVVSHEHDFDGAFFEPMGELGLLPTEPDYRAIDYINLHNPFVVVSHEGNKGKEKRNPHKSYGYLVQPRLGSWLVNFLEGDLEY